MSLSGRAINVVARGPHLDAIRGSARWKSARDNTSCQSTGPLEGRRHAYLDSVAAIIGVLSNDLANAKAEKKTSTKLRKHDDEASLDGSCRRNGFCKLG